VRHVVVPHHKGLDLDISAREEADAWIELDEMQRKIEGVSLSQCNLAENSHSHYTRVSQHRRMRSLLRAGNRAAEAEAERSRRRLDKYDFLRYLVEDPELEKRECATFAAPLCPTHSIFVQSLIWCKRSSKTRIPKTRPNRLLTTCW